MSRLGRALLAACAVAILASPAARAATPSDECLADLAVLPDFLRENDAGARAHLARKGQAVFDTAYAEAKVQASQADSDAQCTAALTHYIRTYRPAHLWIEPSPDAKRRSTAASGDARAPVEDRRPTLRLLSARTALLVLPSFYDRHRKELAALLDQHRRALATRPNLIVDVRRNNGGADSTFDVLMPLIAGQTTLVAVTEFLVTPENVRSTERICEWTSDDIPDCKRAVEPLLAALRAGRPGDWVRPAGPDAMFRYTLPKPRRHPARVAILIDQPCGSACEQFLLTARQSPKVKLYGRPTYGVLDFSNMFPHPLPSGERVLRYALSRSTRLPAFPIDQIGVQPDIFLPPPADDARFAAEVDQVRTWLEAAH